MACGLLPTVTSTESGRRAAFFYRSEMNDATALTIAVAILERAQRLRHRAATIRRMMDGERDEARFGRLARDLADTRRIIGELEPLSVPLPNRLERFTR